MGTKFVNKEEIVSGTRSEDSLTLRLSSLRVFRRRMYSFFCLGYLFFLFVKKTCLVPNLLMPIIATHTSLLILLVPPQSYFVLEISVSVSSLLNNIPLLRYELICSVNIRVRKNAYHLVIFIS